MSDAQTLLQALSEKLMIVRLHVRYPKLQRGIKNAIVELPDGEEIAAELRNAPSWQLLPREWKDRYQAIEAAARRYLHSQSLQPRSSGRVKNALLIDLDIIPLHKAEEIFDQLQEYAAQMQAVHEGFVAVYDELLDSLRDRLGESVFTTLADSLPSRRYIQDAADIVWGILPINSGQIPNLQPIINKLNNAANELKYIPQDLHNAQVELDDIQNHLLHPSTLDTATAKFAAAESRKQLQVMAESLAETVFTEPRKVFAEGVKHLIDSIKGGKQIRNGTLDIVRRACSTLRNFDFVADDLLLAQLQQVETAIEDTSAKDLNNNEELGDQLAKVLELAYNEANNKTAAASSLSKFRRIRHD
jgi:hypothetical protein